MTAAVDRLERDGLVEYGSHARQRARTAHLAAEGRTRIRKLFAGHERGLERVFARLERKQRKALADLLRTLGRKAGALHAERVTEEQKGR